MELLQLRYFCTVARMENISRAAQYHQIPQPAMSKTISKLEKELEAPLFSREKNRLSLTEAGRRFYERVALALQELDGAVEEMTSERQPHRQEMYLLVTALRGRTAEFLALFRRRYPNVTFRVSSSPADTEYDLCISDEPPSGRYDRSLPLMTRQVAVYAAVGKNHPLAKKELLTVEDLQGVPVVSVSESSLLRSVTELCRSRGFSPNIVITCDDLQCLQRYIRSGTGICFTSPYSWPDMADPQIQFVRVEQQVEQQINAYWHSKAVHGKIWQELVEQLRQFFNPTAPYWDQKLD
ncbi:MAG: LysR family transcriptional regulator [Oscillospiraceae bacterium]|nr:LysR family transcriptional regulator [Oscillospiraceae bacterium]